MAEKRCKLERVGGESGGSGRMTFVILAFPDKNFLKYKLKMSLYIFISKILW